MATFLEKDALTYNAEFRTKVKGALLTAANQILADDTRKAEHDFCERVIMEPNQDYLISPFIHLVLANDIIDDKSTDADIQYTVNSIFTKVSDGHTGIKKQKRYAEDAAIKQVEAATLALETLTKSEK